MCSNECRQDKIVLRLAQVMPGYKRDKTANVPEVNDDHTNIVLPASTLQESESIISRILNNTCTSLFALREKEGCKIKSLTVSNVKSSCLQLTRASCATSSDTRCIKNKDTKKEFEMACTRNVSTFEILDRPDMSNCHHDGLIQHVSEYIHFQNRIEKHSVMYLNIAMLA